MKKYFISILNLLIIYSCKNENNNENSTFNKEENITIDDDIHSEKLELDGNKKWIIVPEMMGYLKKIEITLYNFDKAGRKDYFQLANDISELLTELTSHCTMTGKAHDELHKWLVPFIDLSDQLDNTDKLEEQEKIFKEMKTSFLTFNKYFK